MSDPRDDRIRELGSELVAKAERIAQQGKEIEALKVQVAELLRRLNQDSSNSHKPPSSDPPGGNKGKPQRKKGKRKRGGQKGHKGSSRKLLPPEQVDNFIDHFPSECESCWAGLPEVADPKATRYQFTEVPPIRPHTTEHRRHAVRCPHCRFVTRAPYDKKQIPSSAFGPRLVALLALFTGVYHLSRRRTQQLMHDVLGVSISLGAISAAEARASAAVETAVDEVWAHAIDANVKHTDGTGWLQSGKLLSLWTIATSAVTVFKIVANGAKATLRPLFGELKGILISDRATALNFWSMAYRQICWAHLLRKFVSFSERDGPAGEIGEELLALTGIIFEYWRSYRGGELPRARFMAWMVPVRVQVEEALERAVALNIKGLSGSCRNILSHRPALWTFVERDDVDPTNNHGERELRAFVLWRKRSFGSQSDRGNLFAERLMTIAHTARKQNANVLAFLTDCCRASACGQPAPSLLPST